MSEGFAGEAVIQAVAPFRLDLTINVLRRVATNAVDVLTADGRYLRAFAPPAGPPLVVEVVQEPPTAAAVRVRVHGSPEDGTSPYVALATQTIGAQRNIAPFYRRSRAVAWLHAIALRMRGMKPPRYPSLWEALVNAIVFQQISIAAASAMMRRLIAMLIEPVRFGAHELYPFPRPEALLAVAPERLRAAGLSAAKASALGRVATGIVCGELREDELAALPSAEAISRLSEVRGIGAWTATLVLLRGLGRLDVFPGNDSGAARAIRELSRDPSTAVGPILEELGPYRGLLYYHLLLGRLEAAGALQTHPNRWRGWGPRD